ncbi:MAG TPA: ATP-binding protein, partial [Afipia sp.]
IANGAEPTVSQTIRLCIAIAVIAITTVLSVRDQQIRNRLVTANHDLARSRWRYRSIFERSRISLWEQDYSKAVAILDELKGRGITNLADYSNRNPTFLLMITDAVLTTQVNDAMIEVLGVSSRSQAFARMSAFCPNASTMIEVLQAIQDGKDHYQGQGTLIGMDGREKFVLVANSFPPDIASAGRVIGTLVDVTHREKAQQALLSARSELARASRVATVGALSASIAHDLNQPLGAMVMNTQTCLRWLQKNPPDIPAAAAAAQRAVEAGMRASGIVRETRNLLEKRQQRDELVDLQQLAFEVVDLLEREIEELGAKVDIDTEPSLPPVTADRISLQQALVNLLTNALHATADCSPTRRNITILIHKVDNEHIRLIVQDRGSGIPEEDLDKLFDPFFTTKEGGMGMGLAITRMAVEASGGRLIARNHEDGGALFECVLPIARNMEI